MAEKPLNNLDRRILHLLQVDARGKTDTDIARSTDVTSTTIGTRIEDLERRGIVRGYYPDIDYEKAGYPLDLLFVTTAPIADRAAIAESVLDVKGVINVKELLSGEQNLHVTAVADSTAGTKQIAEELDRLGLHIVRSDIVLNQKIQPWNHFHQDIEAEGDDGDGETENDDSRTDAGGDTQFES